MTGSANTPPDSSLAQTLQQAGIAAFKVAGTGTSLDGKWVIGATLIDPDTGTVYKATAGGGGGGAATIADGADVTQGAKADAAVVDPAATASEIALIKGLVTLLATGTAKVNQRRTTNIDDIVGTTPAQAAGTPVLSTVAASVTNVQLLAANAAVVGTSAGRLGVMIVNDSASATLKIAYTATASATTFTDYILPGQTWVMPPPIHPGVVNGIWDAAVGNARLTEQVG